MEYSLRYVRDHVEVFSCGRFLFSADSLAEAYSILEE